MKKARNILVVTLMLVSVLSFGSVANTYAKYTSTKDLSDTAKVAKWDIELSDGTNTQKIWDKSTVLTVNLFNDEIIAPGSKGSFNTSSLPTITNKSEVNADIKVEITKNDYSLGIPLEYCTITDTETCGDTSASWTSWANASAITLEANNVAPGTVTFDNKEVKWRWAYYVSDDQDVKDTDLGKAAALAGPQGDGSTINTPEVELSVKITATQTAPTVTP